MVEVVIGTANAAKARQCELALASTSITTRRIVDFLPTVPHVAEDGTPEENAARKAATYARLVRRPVVSLDYALVFEDVAERDQPGPNVRRIPGRSDRPSDDELLEHYADFFRRYGGTVRGRWRSGIAAATPDGTVARATAEVERVFVATACAARIPGHPLASLQLVGDRYVAELRDEQEVELMRETLREPLLLVIHEVLGGAAHLPTAT